MEKGKRGERVASTSRVHCVQTEVKRRRRTRWGKGTKNHTQDAHIRLRLHPRLRLRPVHTAPRKSSCKPVDVLPWALFRNTARRRRLPLPYTLYQTHRALQAPPPSLVIPPPPARQLESSAPHSDFLHQIPRMVVLALVSGENALRLASRSSRTTATDVATTS